MTSAPLAWSIPPAEDLLPARYGTLLISAKTRMSYPPYSWRSAAPPKYSGSSRRSAGPFRPAPEPILDHAAGPLRTGRE